MNRERILRLEDADRNPVKTTPELPVGTGHSQDAIILRMFSVIQAALKALTLRVRSNERALSHPRVCFEVRWDRGKRGFLELLCFSSLQ